MASGNLLGIGSSALLAYQRALGTVGHNIANVNTEGYSRQRVDFGAPAPQASANGFIGKGVDVSSVRRLYDQYLTADLRSLTASHQDLQTFQNLSAGLDNLLSDDAAGLTRILGSFFDAAQGVADDPTSTAARQVLLSEGDALASRFHDLDTWLQGTRDRVNGQLGSAVQQVNYLTQSIADLNGQIISEQARGAGQPPNDLLDQRDQLILDLSSFVSVSTTSQENGSVNLFAGSGQVLVLGATSNDMALEPSVADPLQFDITIATGGTTSVPITNLVTGGELGGLITFRDEVLNPAHNAMGRIAIEMGSYINEQHRRGVTLDGALGQDFFTVADPLVRSDPGNTGTITTSFDDVSQLTTDDYNLRFNGSAWSLSRSGSNEVVPLSGSGTIVDPFIAEGLSFVIGAGATAGDNYIIQPTRNGAAEIGSMIGDPRDLALASPVSTFANIANTGTGAVSAGYVTDINNAAFQASPGQLSPPVLVRFTSATTYEVVDQGTLTVLDTGTYDPAVTEDIFPTENFSLDYGYRISISGNPAAGDEFTVDFNVGGVGDNRNALLLAGLQTEKLMEGGTTSFNDAYGQLVADVGTRTRHAQINGDAQLRILEQSKASRDSVSGVNLDEEAADLIRFQQAFQAAAQIIAVADQVFNTLLGAVAR